MRTTIKVTGGDKVLKNLTTLEPKIANKILRTNIREAAKELASGVKTNAPVGETGTLRRAVKVRANKRKKGNVGVSVVIDKASFGNEWYATFPEFGSKFQAGQHTTEDVFKAKGQNLADSLREKILQAILKEAND